MSTAAILTNSLFPEVRAAIGTDIGKRALPDKTIVLDLHKGEAERWARKLDTKWAERTGDELRQLQTAVVLKTASLVIKTMPQLLEERFGASEGFRRQAVDIDAKSEELGARALATINGYLNPDNVTELSLPTFFSKACGRRRW
jgi:hypothetical protein